ncbi:MAG: hypothetical protein ACRDX9_11665 [Acidimicrobiia bacterium]
MIDNTTPASVTRTRESELLDSVEVLVISPSGEGHRFTDTTLIVHNGARVPAEQTYTKRSDDRRTFESGDFTADLAVDEHGVVLTHGDPPI